MSSNGSRSKKNSKDEQADRILQSLFLKNKSSMIPSSKKIKKKRRTIQEQSVELEFRTANGKQKTLIWIMPKPRNSGGQGRRGRTSERSGRRGTRLKTKVKSNGNEDILIKKNEDTVNYADLFESAYKVIKSESSANGSNKQNQVSCDQKTENQSQNKSNDSFSGIEYDPLDNYFYLVSHQTPNKKPLFENKGILQPVQRPCLVINPRIVESLKKDYSLESFLC